MGACVFGPVPSRRLGRSLGVDLVPFKTCPYDCIYCQVGKTTQKTIDRKEWVPLEDVVAQVQERLDSEPDFITLSGAGEPTLYSRLGELIGRLKEMTKTPIAVLTNGALLWMPDVRNDLLQADIVVPSLDAPTEGLFRYVNRPHPSISFDQMMQGLVDFRNAYAGKIWLEVFLVAGVTGINEEVTRLAALVRRIKPDRVQINTVVRPPAERFAHPVSPEELERFRQVFGPATEVIAHFQPGQKKARGAAHAEDVFETVARHPCTVVDIAAGLGIAEEEALTCVDFLIAENRIEAESRGAKVYYIVKR